MMPNDAERLARQLIRRHRLPRGWQMVWSDWRGRIAARCSREDRWIVVSKPYVIWNEERAVREVLLHEIAHALCKGGGKHTEEWRRIYISIGGHGEIGTDLRPPPLSRIGRRVRETTSA